MEHFTADFLQFFSITVKISLLGDRLGTYHQSQAFQGFSWKFLISVQHLVRELVYPLSSDNNLVPFHL